ncbi:hypothetical protein [Geobacter sp. SVR]|uniref:hypothetical protein n=1 Tax=Geobacter sp. SVR TaxID=2495594 RepID=UPI00143EFBB8|nr:hypothetical protein [Geobacter sp. SVR]BCS53234.1 hypothetical protein GSVR_15420 [Geobacter sp. SVR]GCF84619.1 hypothetical protein GSbR_12190 [Geobacter sp. SVR]
MPALVSIILVLFLSVVPCLAAEPGAKPGANPPVTTGKKKLLLFAKNPATWSIIKNGGSGKMVYRATTGAFTLTAAGLRSRASYALVRYADTPPKVEILAKAQADRQGRLELAGTWHNWTKKFWLVAAEDVKGKVGEAGSLTAWRPERYLFEEKQLGIPCDCPEPDEP